MNPTPIRARPIAWPLTSGVAPRPAPRSEADHYAEKFGQAKGLIESLLSALNEENETLREPMIEFMKLRAERALEDWKK